MKKLRRDTSDPDAGGLDGQNLVHAAVGEPALEFFADLLKKGNIHLMVQKTVHLQHIVPLHDPVLTDPLLEKLHFQSPSFPRK